MKTKEIYSGSIDPTRTHQLKTMDPDLSLIQIIKGAGKMMRPNESWD
jgi:hypothetical protein